MSLKDEILNNEFIFDGNPKIKYYMKDSTTPNCNFLLVGLSGFNGNEKDGEPPRYNYIKYTKSIDIHQLYILDSNESNIPLYYLGEGNSYYEDKVIQLILSIAKNKNVPLENIITFGSSKGGTAAALFAMKYSLGAFISGGMQTRAGDYLYSLGGFSRNKIIPTITGQTPEIGREIINEKLMNTFNNPIQNTKYFLHGGDRDSHYLNYVKPFVETLDRKNIEYELNVESYEDHGEIGMYFSKFLCEKISEIINIPVIDRINQNVKNEVLEIDINLYSNSINPLYAVYLFNDKESIPVKKIPYQREHFQYYRS